MNIPLWILKMFPHFQFENSRCTIKNNNTKDESYIFDRNSFTRCIITPKLRCLYSFNDYKRIGIRVYQYVPSVVNCLSNTCKHRETGISGEYGEYRDKISDQRWRATYPINRATFLNK